jgi:carbon storage regulator
MLVLTRKIGESIKIGDEIEIVVTAIDQNKVRIGVRSPRNIPVYRLELYQKIRNDNKEAARMGTSDLEEMLAFFPEAGEAILDRKNESDA